MFLCKSLFRGLAITALLVQCGRAQQDRQAAESQITEPFVLKELFLQSGPETRLALIDQLRVDFQRAELIPWAYEQICEAFEAVDQADRALAAGEGLLALDSQDIEIALKGLNVAERKHDAALVQKWAEIAARVAESVLAAPQSGKRRMELARSARAYTDYLSYSEILRIADSTRKVERVQEFLRRRKDSVYRTAAEDLYLETWRQSGDARKTLEAARRILEQNDSNIVALTLVAESYMQSVNEPTRLVTYATRILALLDRQPKPEGLTSAEWSKKKALLAARAHWMIGTAAMQQDRFGEADRSIRAALPFLRADSRMTSAALFYLGWANYRLGKLSDAIRFNKECTLVKGPYREHAEKNLRIIQAETTARN
jgi:tetratricopeptide (TPR) repeat protein